MTINYVFIPINKSFKEKKKKKSCYPNQIKKKKKAYAIIKVYSQFHSLMTRGMQDNINLLENKMIGWKYMQPGYFECNSHSIQDQLKNNISPRFME